MVEIQEVKTRRDLRRFVSFPMRLYRHCPQYIPALRGDDLSDWDPSKNPAYSYCETKCFLALRDGKVVGRIAAILSHRANEKWNTRRMRFSQVDFIDDDEVVDALFGAVEQFAREKGCDEMHGPLGFTDLDREGMLVEGFEERGLHFTYYNYPYYNTQLARLGYLKDVDWLEFKVYQPEPGGHAESLLARLSARTLKRHGLHIATVKRRSEFRPYVEKVFALANLAYGELYGTVDLDEEQIRRYAEKFIPLVDPDFVCFVMNEQEELVAFGVTAPCLSRAFRRAKGRLFPLGFIPVLHDLKYNTALDMLLIAVHPDLRGAGVTAVIIEHIMKNARRRGIAYAETGPQLEKNGNVLSQWTIFRTEQHKRRRCYIKTL